MTNNNLSLIVNITEYDDAVEVQTWYRKTFGSPIHASRTPDNFFCYRILFNTEEEMSMFALKFSKFLVSEERDHVGD